jgi:DUF1707 SHOCT-like domain
MLADDQRSQWLASDEDREEALRALRQALVDGRIAAEQHSERVSKVSAAQYVAELEISPRIFHTVTGCLRADDAALLRSRNAAGPCNLAERLVETLGRGGSAVALLGRVGKCGD